jgi:hypothetical protein
LISAEGLFEVTLQSYRMQKRELAQEGRLKLRC